jgi:hypothetical protein
MVFAAAFAFALAAVDAVAFDVSAFGTHVTGLVGRGGSANHAGKSRAKKDFLFEVHR